MQTENTTQKRLTIFPGSCGGQTAADTHRFLSKSLCLFWHEQGESWPQPSVTASVSIRWAARDASHTHIITVLRAISSFLFELASSLAPCPCSASYETFLPSDLTRACLVLQMTGCIVLQWADHLFFPVNLAVITANIAQAKASNYSASSPPALPGEQRRHKGPEMWFTSCPTLNPLDAQIPVVNQMSAATTSREKVVGARDTCDLLHSQT